MNNYITCFTLCTILYATTNKGNLMMIQNICKCFMLRTKKLICGRLMSHVTFQGDFKKLLDGFLHYIMLVT